MLLKYHRSAGSPPLTRGQHQFLKDTLGSTRITPAHAGTTKHDKRKGTDLWDHPRSRGDNMLAYRCFLHRSGSPPLTRGQREDAIRMSVDIGITPAHAGTTPATIRHHRPRWDHPRSRGDNGREFFFHLVVQGSPPLTRGQRMPSSLSAWSSRITPAHAGTTSPTAPVSAGGWDHPRSRGDN